MADIDVEKKNSIWPWIVAAIVIAIILLIIFIDNDAPAEEVVEEEPVSFIMESDNRWQGRQAAPVKGFVS